MTTTSRGPATVAVVGAGPAGVYAAGILAELSPGTQVDVYEKLPTPYGLVRYGVSPDHPKIRKIIDSLHAMLEHPDVRLLCDVEVGRDITVDELRDCYDAVVIATGAIHDVPVDLPGLGLPGSFGAADLVSWYDNHPDFPQAWPLEAESVAVIGAGNVALDVTRMLVRHARTLAHTDIADNVMRRLQANPVRDIHLFARRGPVDVRFSPGELRELGEQEDVDVIVDPVDLVPDLHTERMTKQFSPKRQVMQTFERWAQVPAAARTASRRVHLHFYRAPVAVLGTDRVEALRTERTVPDGYGHVTGSGETEDHFVQAVYRAIGYASTPLPGVPFDDQRRVIPHDRGAVLGDDGLPLPRLYATGWIKRGPMGLIGATKSDARETVETVLSASRAGDPRPGRPAADAILRRRNVRAIDWEGWLRIDAAEQRLGARSGRARIKIATRPELTAEGRRVPKALDGVVYAGPQPSVW